MLSLLKRALPVLGLGVSYRVTDPQSSMLRVNGRNSISTDNLEVSIEAFVESDLQGDAMIYYTTFHKIAKKMTGDERYQFEDYSLNLKDNNLIFKSGKVKASLNTLEPSRQTPKRPLFYKKYLKMPFREFSEIIENTSHCAALENSGRSNVLSSICFHVEKNSLKTAATNGSCLAFRELSPGRKVVTSGFKDDKILIPASLLVKINSRLKAFKIKSSDIITLCYDEETRHAVLIVDIFKINFYALDGQYPEFKQLIPEDVNFGFNFRSEDMIRAIEQAKPLLNPRTKILKMQFFADRCEIKGFSPSVGEIETSIKIDKYNYKSTKDVRAKNINRIKDGVCIAFNADFLLKGLKQFRYDPSVKIAFDGGLSPTVITGYAGNPLLFMIMPIQIK